MRNLYIGLMSGTSADGIDAALVDFSATTPALVATHYTPYTAAMREAILALATPGDNEIQRLGELDIALGEAFANASLALLTQAKVNPESVRAIGSHGQTIRHQPRTFSLQIGDPNVIAARTGITTVADFRRKDIALGGQGAPLVPAFHREVLATRTHHRAVVNIGGIANVTLLPADDSLMLGFDTGPGNALLDGWIHQHQQKSHDQHGDWGRSGTCSEPLLHQMLADPYFQQPAPKSTGREYFNAEWLKTALRQHPTLAPADVQATLTALTAHSILKAIKAHWSEGEILICGGGAHNTYLMDCLKMNAGPHFSVTSTEDQGIPPDWMEAMAFAWLAKQTLTQQAGNCPSVTGAARTSVLGGVYTSA